MSRKKLTAKQNKFCLEYLKDFNASQAALRAGYSRNRHKEIGYQLLHKPTLQIFLGELIQKQAEKAEITVEWIIKELKQMYERCQSSLSSPGAIAGATKQLELLGKYLGMWIDKSEHTEHIQIDIINFSDVKTIDGEVVKHKELNANV